MDSFILDGTEFGISAKKSRLAFKPEPSGGFEMDLVIHGDESTYVRLEEVPEWSWSLYPPKFYLDGYPVPNAHTFTAQLNGDDCENYDTAIYMMEHNSIASVAVDIAHGSKVEIRGEVELSGKIVAFAIRWLVASAIA